MDARVAIIVVVTLISSVSGICLLTLCCVPTVMRSVTNATIGHSNDSLFSCLYRQSILIRFGALECDMITIGQSDLPRSGLSFRYDHIRLDRIVPIESTDALCFDRIRVCHDHVEDI